MFLPVFLTENAGMNSAQLGILLAIGPFASILAQPLWGLRADRARYKNTVLLILLGGSLLASQLIPLYANFWYIMAAMFLLTSFSMATVPISDTITVELCQERAWDYGRIRTAGSVGYSTMGWVSGIWIAGNNARIFPLFAAFSLVTIAIAVLIPRVGGHQRVKIRMPYIQLLKNKRLATVLAISFVANVTLGMHYSFFGVYFRELGGTTAMLGLAAFCASMLELPFTLNAKNMIRKIGGPEKTLLLSAAVMGARWLLASQASTPLQLLLVNCLHGFSFAVLSITVTLFLGEHIPPELKASGQTLHGMLSLGLARIAGSVGGGLLIALWGKPGMFFTAGVINGLLLLAFVPLVWKRKQAKGPD
jgi:PPP family 3-phenylpropionic acid transporter